MKLKKKAFSVTIDAPREKVWEQLWGETSYPKWTAVFSQGSRAETDWKKGSKVYFLNDKNEGMVSLIAESIPNEYLSLQHKGNVANGVEDLESPEAKEWAGSEENYTLKTVNGKTELTVEIDLTEEFEDMFNSSFPAALKELKKLSEQ